MKTVILLSLLSVASALPTIGTLQSTAIEGKLTCNGKPYEKARLKLYEVDPVFDHLMSEGLSDVEGHFILTGNDTEWSTIDPKLNVYHNCNDENVECWRKFSIRIPKTHIFEGAEPKEVFNAGNLNLDAVLPGESRDCLN